jgi:putative thioredoxin
MACMATHVRDISTAEFPSAVLQRSQEIPVVVDFWAEWCGPCKVLGPTLERLAEEMDGAFELVKVDVDANQQLAAQFGVQGIPMVVGFRHGAPVSHFTGALPEQAVRSWLVEILPTELDAMVDEARDAVLAGDNDTAEARFREVLDRQADHVEAGTGLASLLISKRETEEALIVLGKLAPTAEVERLQAAARLTASESSDIGELEAKLAADTGDDVARIELANALAGKGQFEPALDHLIGIIERKTEHKDDARKAMLDIFDVIGDGHPLTGPYRRRLANALF